MRIVSVMAHQDDELTCLGTMLRMRARGDTLAFICLTDGSGGMVHMPHLTREQAAAVRREEMSALCAQLDAPYVCLNEKDEYLYDMPAVRDGLIAALREVGADVVFTHSRFDYNLDHMTVNALVRQCAMQAAFPMVKSDHPPIKAAPAVFECEPSGSFEFEPSHWVDITPVLKEKQRLACFHKSQDDAFRAAFGYGIDTWMLGSTTFRGAQAGVAHAEAFRPMLARNLIRPYPILP